MLVLLVALAAIASLATDRLYRTSEDRYVKEAFPLRTYTRDLILQMLNEETGVRGYIITADRRSLGPYVKARPAVVGDFEGLRKLTGRRPEIATDVVTLRRLVRRLDVYFARQVALVARGPAGQFDATEALPAGTASFDRFRVAAGRLLTHSEEIVHSAERSQRRTFWSTLALVISTGAIAAAIGFALLAFLPRRLGDLYRREQDARRSAERGDRASRALAHVDDAVVLLDSDEVIRYWNPAAASTFGIDEHDAIGHAAAEAIPDLDVVEQALARGGDGAIVPLATGGADRWYAVGETTFPEGRVIVLRDVTGEQELDRARSEFLATASHELRTPLTAVYGAVRTLRRADRPDEPGLTERLLSMIEQESQRLATIVDQILVSAQLDRETLRLERTAVDLRELCESVIASASLRAGDRRIELDSPTSLVVECDPGRLRQVLVNLLDNAVKYSPDETLVGVRVREERDGASVTVSNEGMGIRPDVQTRIFEKFYRADPDMLGGVGGSGLGLYISREIVEQMGGTITVRSRVGEGASFTVYLPRRRADH